MTDDVGAAYRAAKESAAVFDLTGWTAIGLSGADCVKFLHNFCTADIKGLPERQGCEAFLTNVKARVIGHVGVFPADNVKTGRLSLLAIPGQAERLVSHLDRYVITEDVTIRDQTNETALYYVIGPLVTQRLEALMSDRPAPATAGRFSQGGVKLGDEYWLIYRVDWLGLPGYLFWMPRERHGAAAEALSSIGVTGSLEAFESLRIASCFPFYGVDVTEDHLAPEVGRPWAISYTKGCYLGQEPIARIDALGHVNRLLCGMRLDSDVVPDRGAPVVAGGKEIGSVTSAALNYCDGRAVALGYLRTKFAESGTLVAIRTAEGEVGAVVYRAAVTA